MDRVLYRNSAFVIARVFLFAFVGFWPTYFSKPFQQENWRFHFHALVMIAWCVLLVSQAYLIRSNNRPLHRQLGKTSFGLVPLIVISTLALAHYRLKPNDGSDLTLYSLALPAFALCQLFVAYGLAIYNRRNPVIHARFMICTALVMIPAIFDRIMSFFLLPPV